MNSNDKAQTQEKRSWMANLAGNEKIIPTHLKVQNCARVQKGVSKLNLKPQVDLSAEFDNTVDGSTSI